MRQNQLKVLTLSCRKLKYEVQSGLQLNYQIQADGSLRLARDLCVPNMVELKQLILTEVHST